MINKIHNMNCLDGLKLLADNSVDMVITSPPYFKLRDYGSIGEIGSESDCNTYLDNLMAIFTEIHRVLKDTGSCWVNIDDVYVDQSLLCIPDKFKIRMVESGWICRNEIIWHKPNAMPSSAKTRFNNDYEKLFFFTKKTKYFFDTQYEAYTSTVTKSKGVHTKTSKYRDIEQESSVRQGMNKTRGQKVLYLRKKLPTQLEFVTFMRSRTSVDKLVENTTIPRTKIEHWFRKDNSGFSFPSTDDWNTIAPIIDDGSDLFEEMNYRLTHITVETDDILKNAYRGRIKRAVWSINTKPFKGCHYAPYPEKLIEIPIKACCPVNGIVLDPFMGSGTTAVVARKLNRNYIGFELSKTYCDIADERLRCEKGVSDELEKQTKL